MASLADAGSDVEFQTAVVDIGSSSIKFAPNSSVETPTEFPLLKGTPADIAKQVPGCDGDVDDDEGGMYGQKAKDNRGLLNVTSPVVRGGCPRPTDQKDLEKILSNIYGGDGGLECPETTKYLLTVPTLCPWSHRAALAKFHFESEDYKSPEIAMFNQAVLALYGTGNYTGLSCDVGHGVAQAVPIFGGYALPSCMRRTALAGSDIDEHLQRLLSQEGHSFNTSAEMLEVRRIKEQHIYIALDYKAEFGNATAPTSVSLPDGTTMSLTKSRFLAAEPLFSPEMIGRQMPGVQGLIKQAVMASPIDLRTKLLSELYVSGGCSIIRGFAQRLQQEVDRAFEGATAMIKNATDENRKFAVFEGAVIQAQLSNHDVNYWITLEEYQDVGENIVFRKGVDRYFSLDE